VFKIIISPAFNAKMISRRRAKIAGGYISFKWQDIMFDSFFYRLSEFNEA
jgi:hypothetical protein